MNFDIDHLTEEQQLISDTFNKFADKEITPNAEAIDAKGEFPMEQFMALAELGFFRLRYPEESGGVGADFVSFCLAVQAIAKGSLSLAAAVSMQSLMGTHFLHKFGNTDILERLFQPALDGKKIAAICITEPNAGSDLSSIATAATKVEGGYRINGQKMWITSAPLADFFTVFARTGEEKKLTMFVVEKDFKGLHVGKTIHKMGCYALPTSEVAFEDCFVPDSHRLGEEGEGELQLREILSQIRVMTGALALGVGEAAIKASLEYAADRKQFGKPLNRFQAIQLKLGEMGTDWRASAQLVYYAARLNDQGKLTRREAAMAKLFSTEAIIDICDKATRIYGSYGFAMEYPVQRYFRDIRFTLYGGGTSEILKMLIAREMRV